MSLSAEEAETRRREEEKKTVVTRLSSDASPSRGSQRLVGVGIVSEELEGHRELEERRRAGFTSACEAPPLVWLLQLPPLKVKR